MGRARTFAVFFVLLLVVSCNKGKPVADRIPSASLVDNEIAAEAERLNGLTAQAEYAARAELRAKAVESDPESDPLWAGFRRTFPYHVQEIAVSNPQRDGSRTIIVSEPPPEVSIDDILAAARPGLVSYRIQTHPIGYDGWLRDVVLRVSGDNETLVNVVSSLNRVIYRTSYKSYVLPLPARRPARRAELDLDVTTTEIAAWIDEETFVPVLGGNSMTAEQAFAQTDSTVYFTTTPGLVAWWIPRGVLVDDLAVEARQFALDSDLVIGAIRRDGGVMIVARERQVPVQELPPLRFETIRLLSNVSHGREGELQQSYQRRAPFAGIMGDGTDWAPIYLSPELVDTEYGSLLNITDQLLKGWSEGGNVRYVRFEEYPRPRNFPFHSLLKELGGNRVTYNWNTTGVGYIVPSVATEIFALNRTGALPVSYIPDGVDGAADEVITAEEDGYRYFAKLNDPNLVRVVQYAALYQIFSAFEIRGRAGVPSNDFPAKELERLTEQMAVELKSVTNEENIEAVADRINSHIAYFGIPPQGAELLSDVQRVLEKYRKDERPEAADDELTLRLTLSAFACMRGMPQSYSESVAKRANGWIHTPVIVQSWTSAPEQGFSTGGHNLRARTTKVTVTDSVPAGHPEYTAEGELRIHPIDEKRAPELIYLGAKAADRQPAQVATRLRQALARPAVRAEVRPRAAALRLAASSRLTEPAPHFRVRGATTGKSRGWRTSSTSAAVETTLAHGVFIERRADRSIRIAFEDGRRQVEAATIEDATDAIVQILKHGGGGDEALASVELRGFQAHEANGFLRAANNRMRGTNREMSALVNEGHIDPVLAREIRARQYDFANAKVAEGPLRIVNGRPQAKIVIEIPRQDVSGVARTEVTVALHPEMKPSLIARIMTEIRVRIQKVITELGNQWDAFTFNLRINREIKALSRETGVPIDIVEQQFIDASDDLHFAVLDVGNEKRPAA